ncbi:MAG: hypothetical protein LBN40_06485 [Oscillospiraceae bacterium]|jgi:D-alanyl-D-alanine carboxypeptidase (penicillin-binding protein 5/6)|nr:hypothetical protein [Oscillospiraceae bacterium]
MKQSKLLLCLVLSATTLCASCEEITPEDYFGGGYKLGYESETRGTEPLDVDVDFGEDTEEARGTDPNIDSSAAPTALTLEPADTPDTTPDEVQVATVDPFLSVIKEDKDDKPQASGVFVVGNNTITYGLNLDKQTEPGGVTKLLTALTAFDVFNGALTAEIDIGNELNLLDSDSKRAGLYSGKIVTLETALAGLLVAGGNDAAYSIAVNAAETALGGSDLDKAALVKYFVEMMNEKARTLGMDASVFVNPDGIHAVGQATTARDMLRLSAAVAETPALAKLAGTRTYSGNFLDGTSLKFENSLPVIASHTPEGLRSGYSDDTGYLFAGLFNENGKTIVTFVTGCDTPDERVSRTVELLGRLTA